MRIRNIAFGEILDRFEVYQIPDAYIDDNGYFQIQGGIDPLSNRPMLLIVNNMDVDGAFMMNFQQVGSLWGDEVNATGFVCEPFEAMDENSGWNIINTNDGMTMFVYGDDRQCDIYVARDEYENNIAMKILA